MTLKLLMSLLFFSVQLNLSAQKYSSFKAAFSLIEKNTLKDTSSLVHGDVTYELTSDQTDYYVIFPSEEIWSFKDSLVTITRGQEIKTKNGKAEINQLTIFNKILTTSLKDFGLKESGFSIDDIEEDDNSIIITWTPPEAAQPFLEYVVTEVKDNLLRSVLFYDVDGKAINKTFYDDYAMINGLPVPHKIKSHFKAQKEEIFKILSFSDVQIY